MLKEIRSYLQMRKMAPLQDIALHCQINLATAEQGLMFWEQKGKVRKLEPASCQAGCASCTCLDAPKKQMYQWLAD